MSDLYQLHDGWELKKFSDIFKIISSKQYQINKSDYLENAKIPVIDQGKHYIVGYTNNEDKIFNNNDNIIVFGDHTRNFKYIDFDFVVGADGIKLITLQDMNNYIKFFYYQFLSKDIKHLGYSRHFKLLKEMDIALPPLEEQKRIVSKLDNIFTKLDKAINLHQKNIDEANAFMGSILNEVFSELEEKYEKVTFKDIVDNFDGSRKPIKAQEREQLQGKYPYYGASGIIDTINDYIFDGEYLLISEDGANLTVRKYPIAFIAQGKFWVNNHAHIVIAKKEITTNKFLEYYFVYTDISSYITGSAQPKLSQGKLNTIYFTIPPLEKQKTIVEYLDQMSSKMDKIKDVQTIKMKELKALKSSILDTAFKGEL
jgi:type I restriction enzyme, S subunit